MYKEGGFIKIENDLDWVFGWVKKINVSNNEIKPKTAGCIFIDELAFNEIKRIEKAESGKRKAEIKKQKAWNRKKESLRRKAKRKY
jgi:hypothetical protein